MFIVKFVFYFFISFIILCFPLQDKPIFDHAYHIVSPITSGLFKVMKQKLSSSTSSLGRTVSSMWSSSPDGKETTVAAPVISDDVTHDTKELPIDEQYTLEEREILDRVMREYKDRNKH